MKRFFFYLSIFLVLASCKNEPDYNKQSANAEIKQKVTQLYRVYGQSNEALYNQPIETNLFSSDLKEILEKSIYNSKTDIKKVKSSNYPTDKPLLLEGAVFSSLYEGYTSYNIKSIDIISNRAKVTVDFEYDKVSPKIIWTDTIHLINTDHQWKIDNISFNNSISNSSDLKSSLNAFISYAENN
ncbi:hypothetical protein CJF12_19940 [Chryseobacterium piperi]|uniref:hypothetical protein n=1 Tax=Chryseobacterium piperi TaxID=558152 RepID=UPI00068A5B2D|nr:hypothetical protein [Chryseobacterium piperi]ATL75917.1 hypothetical protein CJF12_19940 [Chryseobacterium piperi]